MRLPSFVKHPLSQVLIVLVVCSGVISCNRSRVASQVMPSEDSRPVYRTTGDTITYYIAFENKKQRRHFASSLEEFLRRYGDSHPLLKDTVRGIVRIQIPPSAKEILPVADSLFLRPLEQATISESTVVMQIDTTGIPVPKKGGEAVLYSFRSDFGRSYGALFSTTPFALPTEEMEQITPEEAATFPITVSRPSPTRIRLHLSENFLNQNGQRVSAFDIVQAWVNYVKDHPAEGKALFRHVQGLQGFLRGEEATIPGIVSTDNSTVLIRLASPDPFCLQRLKTHRLLPAALKIGPYALQKSTGARLELTANTHYRGIGPFLDNISLVLDRDSNPFLGFSLKKYSMLSLFAVEDLAYARESFGDKADLIPLGTDRYFLVISDPRDEVRSFVMDIVDPQTMLTSVVRAEGEVIHAIGQIRSAQPQERQGDRLPKIPFVQSPLKILYLQSDPVSALIAEDLLADLSNAGVPCSLMGAKATEYERAAVSDDYSIAVAWAPGAIVNDPAEQLRVASIWFDDETDEQKRIATQRELPLFSLQRYALCHHGLEFFQGALQGIYWADKTSDQGN